MKSYDELKTDMEAIQLQMVEAKKNERANALKEVRHEHAARDSATLQLARGKDARAPGVVQGIDVV